MEDYAYDYSEAELKLIAEFDMLDFCKSPHFPPHIIFREMAVKAICEERNGPEVSAVARALNNFSKMKRCTPEFDALLEF